jgi:putative membrane protein
MKNIDARRIRCVMLCTVTVLSPLMVRSSLGAQTSDASKPPMGATPTMMRSGDSTQSVVALLAIASRDEIEAGRLALKKAKRADVKAYAQRMIDDHTKALRQLSDSGRAGGWSMPDSTMSSMSGKWGSDSAKRGSDSAMKGSDSAMKSQHGDGAMQIHNANVAAMQKLSTAPADSFDYAYVASQVEGHEMLLKAIDKHSTSNAQLSGMVASMKQTVQQHLDAARKLQSTTSASRP